MGISAKEYEAFKAAQLVAIDSEGEERLWRQLNSNHAEAMQKIDAVMSKLDLASDSFDEAQTEQYREVIEAIDVASAGLDEAQTEKHKEIMEKLDNQKDTAASHPSREI